MSPLDCPTVDGYTIRDESWIEKRPSYLAEYSGRERRYYVGVEYRRK